MNKVSSINGLKDKVPSLRFKEFGFNWTKYRAEYIFENIIDKNHPNETVLTIIQGLGTVSRENAGRNIKYDEKSIKNYKKVKKGDFIIHLRSFEGGLEIANTDGVVSPAYTILRNIMPISSTFYNSYFHTDEFINHILTKSVEGIRDGRQISYEAFKWLEIPYCDIKEQEKISNFLDIINERIVKQQNLVDSLKKYKRGLFQMIFERKIGLYNSDIWSKKQLGEIFVERFERATGNEELLSVTINEGVKKRSEINGKDNSSNDKAKYKKVYKNDIVYNTMRMWQGSSGLSRYNGIVSPAYTVVITTGDNNPEFFSYYFKYYKLIKVFQKHSQGLTSDTWNLKYPAFSKIFILVPSLKTQNEIVVILKKLDSLITYNESVLNNINEIKKGLLQQLFI